MKITILITVAIIFAIILLRPVSKKELKKLGHEVVHAYFSEDKGPKGDMESRDIRFEAITIPGSYSKSNFISASSLASWISFFLVSPLALGSADMDFSTFPPLENISKYGSLICFFILCKYEIEIIKQYRLD